jgi:hypothetical protein
MDAISEDELRERAYFVAGIDAWFRAPGDPLVESAIRDAVAYIGSLSDQDERPALSGGDTAANDRIVALFWLVNTASGIKTVDASFFGNGICSASWPTSSGRENERTEISIDELRRLNLPRIVAGLRRANQPNRTPPPQPN